MGGLLEAVKTEDEALAHHFKKSEEWATVEEMIAAHGCKYIEDIQICGMNMPFISLSEAKNAYFINGQFHSKKLNFLFITYNFKHG